MCLMVIFVVVDKTGVRIHIPIGGVACLMLEPGTRVSHAACALAARVGTLLVWIGEAGVRLYSAGHPAARRPPALPGKTGFEDSLRLMRDQRNQPNYRRFIGVKSGCILVK